ncbi:hypothetical protein L0657_19195 [Dyadobacter sp. CY345]|uniref:DUF6973 domain-containing protein n=1 Tax=Dyadobacter sp. CY345 TaxID=2909335 RepID=UPI001F26E6AA|nr:hypothetical protein [Dyadobacter sp. CY345]MCF2446093.1 hypothetical protein [Dyadobacter sp. CY345]
MNFRIKNGLLLSLFSILLYSCSEPSVKEESKLISDTDTKLVTFRNLKAKIPVNYPEELLKYGPDDLQLIAAKGKGSANMRTTEGNSFDEIAENVLEEYPSFDEFKPEQYKKYFPELSENEIQENSEDILDFMEKLMGYEVAISVSTLPEGRNLRVTSGNNPGEANSCEKWYYANHLRLDKGGIEYAAGKALDYTTIYYGSNANDHTMANSFLHAVWNILLGKHAAYRYGDVWKAREVIEGLTDAHECDSPDDEKQMDLHNNDVGLEYFNTYAERYKKNLVDHNVRLNKLPQEYCDYIYYSSAVKIARGSSFTANNYTRVYYD